MAQGLGLDPFQYLATTAGPGGGAVGSSYNASGTPDQGGYSTNTQGGYDTNGRKPADDVRDEAEGRQLAKELEAKNKLGRDDIKARLKIAEMQIGSANSNAAAQIAVERERIAQSQRELEQLGIPRLELDRWKAQKETELQQGALDLDKERLSFEKDKTAQQLEFDKAKWRDENANTVRALDFDERKFDQNLQFEREREAGRLGLDKDKYVQDKAEQDRRYALDLSAQGFQQGLSTRKMDLEERKQWAEEQHFGDTFHEGQRQFNETKAEQQRQFNADIAEKARQFDLSTAEGRRQFDLTFGEGARQFDLTTAEGQRQYNESLAQRQHEFGTTTALDVAKTAAGMGGPGDWAQYLDYTEGVQNVGDVPVFVQRLLNPNAGGGGSATGPTPASRTLQGVAANIAGVPQQTMQQQAGAPGAAPGSPEASAQQVAGLVRANPPSKGGGWNDRDLQILNTIDQIYASPHKAQGYEQMSDDEKAFLASGAKKAKQSQATFNTKYAQSRIGQGSAAA